MKITICNFGCAYCSILSGIVEKHTFTTAMLVRAELIGSRLVIFLSHLHNMRSCVCTSMEMQRKSCFMTASLALNILIIAQVNLISVGKNSKAIVASFLLIYYFFLLIPPANFCFNHRIKIRHCELL